MCARCRLERALISKGPKVVLAHQAQLEQKASDEALLLHLLGDPHTNQATTF